MTIHNIYLVAGVIFWLYILVCLMVKMYVDLFHTRRLQKQRAFISRFFSHKMNKDDRDKSFKKLARLVQDDLLLDYACDHYLEATSLPGGERDFSLDIYMKRLFHQRIAEAAGSTSSRCLLLAELQRCGLASTRIQHFIRSCSAGSPLEQQWTAKLPSEEIWEPEMAR